MATQLDLLILTIASIEANAHSLAAQLTEYDHLYVNADEQKQLDEIEKQLHALRGKIINRPPAAP